MSHSFTVGRTYRNRQGEYEVLAIHGDQMTIRYKDGVEKSANVTLQARIWENIQADEAPPPPRPRRTDDDDGLDTQPIGDLVQTVLATFTAPYPRDITDQICLAIEQSPEWLARYHRLVEHFSSQGKDGKRTVNTSIGWFTKSFTGMVNLGRMANARSQLIQSYSELGYPK
jgi:hypothetical protein